MVMSQVSGTRRSLLPSLSNMESWKCLLPGIVKRMGDVCEECISKSDELSEQKRDSKNKA